MAGTHLAVEASSVLKTSCSKDSSPGSVCSVDLAAINTPADVPASDLPVGVAAVAYVLRPEACSLRCNV